MGAGSGKINTNIPVDVIVKRIDDCVVPDEKEVVLDFLEILEAKLEMKRSFKVTAKQFKDCNGIPIVIEVLKLLLEDDAASRMGVAIFEFLKESQPVVMDFIVYGGLDWLTKVKETYASDELLAMSVPKLIKAVLEIGASAAIGEIRRETLNLQMCQTCQETAERARRVKSSAASVKIPLSSDRANRVCMFMDNYGDRPDVLVPGLDAIIAYVRNADSKKSINSTKVVEVVSTTAQHFPKSSAIMWRAYVVFAAVASFSDDFASDIVDLGMHELMVSSYKEFHKECRVQQQMLWMISACLQWPKCSIKVQESKASVIFFRKLLEERAHLIQDVDKNVKSNPFELVVPLQIRSFMRETKGEFIVKDKTVVVQKKTMKRRMFKPKPTFGTVDTEIFAGGEPGLIPAPGEDGSEAVVGPEADMDWESRLNYGAAKSKKKAPVNDEYKSMTRRQPSKVKLNGET